MRAGRLALLATAAAAAALSSAPAGAQDDTIPAGVTVGGVAVGGLTREAARARLEQAIARPLRWRLVVYSLGRRYSIMPRAAGAQVDPRALAETAYRLGRQRASVLTPGPDGSIPPVALDVPVRVPVRAAAVRDLVGRVARGLYVPARNSELRVSLRRVWASPAHAGRRLAGRSALAARVTRALRSWTGSRLIRARTRRVRPRITPRGLRAITGAVVTVSRHERKARLFTHLRFRKSYSVAVGQPAYPTPTGLFHVYAKQVDPAWSVPRRSSVRAAM